MIHPEDHFSFCFVSNYELYHNAHTHSPPTCYGLGSVFRFHRIRRCRVSTRLHRTKPTATCASIPENHDRRSCNSISTSIPTLRAHITIQNSTKKQRRKKKVKKIEANLSYVGALCLFANGVELQLRKGSLNLLEPFTLRSFLPQPLGLLHVWVSARVRAQPTRPNNLLLYRDRRSVASNCSPTCGSETVAFRSTGRWG